ncbi:TIR domain-containing protein [Cryptosporangium aurantiacum]|uniref:TIR domain-containing protein n=1 Tax=Cryptosporangium aurantiacum TaxID=134849 RepID=A0A1M7RMM1_9ACTN|nr:TIR domain-containing protein [Cryptosporangium aurantiacum]SHN47430.1 TIR domain-containing protein [Cryptosporangium aurantiacum]
MPLTFLLSVAAADAVWASRITDVLDQLGYSWRHVSGRNELALNPSLDAVRADAPAILIMALSPTYFTDSQTNDLWPVAEAMAGRGRLRLLPVKIGWTSLPPPLRDYPYLDLSLIRSPLTAVEQLRTELRRLGEAQPAPVADRRTGPLRVAVAGAGGELTDRVESAVRGLRAELVDRGTQNPPPAEADVVLLMLSHVTATGGYLNSDEFREVLRRQAAGLAIVVPVLVEPVNWENLPLGQPPTLPRGGGKALSRWESLDEGVQSVVDGVRLICEELVRRRTASSAFDIVWTEVQSRGLVDWQEQEHTASPLADEYALDDVFKRSGAPTLTFVEPLNFARFVSALRAPGRGLVLEGPSGIGKTTLLLRAIERLAPERRPIVLSGRRRADLDRIARLPDGHTGTVAVDDVHRLPRPLRTDLADYLKLLADEESDSKLILIGIPGTGESLVELGHDLATRIDVFRLPAVSDATIDEMIRKGERALNVEFAHRSQIALAAAGSLLTAQMLCWELVAGYRIERTRAERTPISADVGLAVDEVVRACELKYGPALRRFAALDGPTGTGCVALLAALRDSGRTGADGVVRVDSGGPDLWPGFAALAERYPNGFADAEPDVAAHLHYEPQPGYLVAEDPQLLFYLRRLSVDRLYEVAGKRRPRVRDQVFVSYSHADHAWLERLERHLRPLTRDQSLDLWSDRRLRAGDRWRDEIADALDRARAAILLVSSDFLASDFISEIELPALLRAAESGGCRIIPIVVSPCMFEHLPDLAQFQAVNSADRPLTAMSAHEQDETLLRTALALRDLPRR